MKRIRIDKLEQLENIRNEKQSLLNPEIFIKVRNILADIENNGDKSLFEYTCKFDKIELTSETVRITSEEIKESYNKIEKSFIDSIKAGFENIKEFHEIGVNKSWLLIQDKDTKIGQLYNPMERVGIYVPGGTAPLFSTVLMSAIPAKIAGVEQIVLVSPPSCNGSIDPNILVTADLCGIKEIYKVGGAQAIGALAYGTESIKKVDKIVGPGNIYVTVAKKEVYGMVDIDMVAGPSEILVLADDTAKPEYIIFDLLSQAEHDTLASSILVTTSDEIADYIENNIYIESEKLYRTEIINTSLKDNGKIIVCKNMELCIHAVNKLAPEHLEIIVEQPEYVISKIKNAGALFIGNYTPEPVGDYFAGPSHVLPTSGTARYYSPLFTDDFIKKSSMIWYSPERLKHDADNIMLMAETEQLEAHKKAVAVRV